MLLSASGLDALDEPASRERQDATRRRDLRPKGSTVAGAGGWSGRAVRREETISMDMSQYSGAAFLKVGDIKVNGPVRVVIADVQIGDYGKPDLSFTDGTRLSVNTTNNKILCQAYGTESDEWIGREIEL